MTPCGRLAQLDRVLASEAKGRRFESGVAHQLQRANRSLNIEFGRLTQR